MVQYSTVNVCLSLFKGLGIGKELDKQEKAECAAFVSLVKLNLFQSMVSRGIVGMRLLFFIKRY